MVARVPSIFIERIYSVGKQPHSNQQTRAAVMVLRERAAARVLGAFGTVLAVGMRAAAVGVTVGCPKSS